MGVIDMGLFKRKITFNVTILVEKDDETYYAHCPALKGLHVEGSTEDEACSNAVDAAIAYIKSLINHGEPIPLVVEEPAAQPFLPAMPAPAKCVHHQVPVTI